MSVNKKSSEKIKCSKPKTIKKAMEGDSRSLAKEAVLQRTDTKLKGDSNAKKRLGQIEKDYQKVVENLNMVERMMACINERMMNQKMKQDQTSQETVVIQGKTNLYLSIDPATTMLNRKNCRPSKN